MALGPAIANNLNNSQTMYGLTLGNEWEVGSQNSVLVELNSAFGNATTFIDALLGAKYFFSDLDTSPFLKGALGLGVGSGRDVHTASGFAGNVALGLTMFRTSTVHLEVEGGYSAVFASNSEGNPGMTSITLGIFF